MSENRKYPLTWLYISLFCIVFALIYEYFSHGVHTRYMELMFLFPLLLGTIGTLLMKKLLHKEPSRFYQDGILLLTLWSLMKGVLIIYGTTSFYTVWLLRAGLICLSIGIILMFIPQKNDRA